MHHFQIEVCANSVISCIEAQKGGANRVELCAAIPEGGTTPSYGEIVMAREVLKETKLHVIIRPRSGDFLFSDIEHAVMLKDIEICRVTGVDGVVIGTLTKDGEVDMSRNRELIDAAGDMSVTFHRAFDMTFDAFKSLEDIVTLGCHRILTSGQKPKAEEGIDLLKELVQQAGERVIIMPGCGVNESNICRIANETGATQFHLSARNEVESEMAYRNPRVSMGGTNITVSEYSRLITDSERVRQTINFLNRKR